MLTDPFLHSHTFPGSFVCFKYHGEGRKEAISDISRAHIVLTTYATLAADNNSKRSVINTLHWYRLVLDEGKTKIERARRASANDEAYQLTKSET